MTSDCPVHRLHGAASAQEPPVGLADPRIKIRFPLCRDKFLVVKHDHAKVHKYAELEGKGRIGEAERLRFSTPEISYRTIGENEVREFNAHTISMAARWVFSPTEDDSISKLFVGECRNMRYRVEWAESLGLIGIATEFPTSA